MPRPLSARLALATFLLSAGSASAAVDGTLTPDSITSTSTTPVVLHLTGLAPGAAAVVQRFVDANADGSVDAGEFLAESFTVTDGQVTSIAGVRNTNVPGDEDGAADGQISTHLAPANGAELGRLAGQQLIRVSSPSAAFTTFTRTLTITQAAQAQAIICSVTDGTNPVPYAGVFLLVAGGDGDFALGVVANAAGQCTVNAPVGTYQVAATMAGYVTDFAAAPVVALEAGTTPAQNLQVAVATTTISGTVADAVSSAGLGGVQLFVGTAGDLVTVISTNADGTYVVPVTAGQWNIEVSEVSVGNLGYLTDDNEAGGLMADTTSGAATGVDLSLTKATALVYGTVTNSSATPLAGIEVSAGDTSGSFYNIATTDANGQYILGVTTGEWHVNISNESPGLAGYVIPDNQNVTITGAQAVQTNFVLLTVNAHLQGVVTNNGSPVSGIRVGAYNQSTNQFISVDTAPDGTFDLGVVAGTWSVQIESSSAAAFNIISPSNECTVGENQTLSGITIAVLTTTWQISGYVRDSGSQPINADVFANATINSLNYSAFAQTDGGGNYTLPVIDGTWQVGVNASGYQNPDNVPTIVSGSSVTVNFTLQSNLESWRMVNFGDSSNSGDGANLNDFDKDGIVNLVEYAFGLDPKQNSAGQLPRPALIGNQLVVSFNAPQWVSGITYGAEWSTSMEPGSWISIPNTGSFPQHMFSVSLESEDAVFGRLKITSQ